MKYIAFFLVIFAVFLSCEQPAVQDEDNALEHQTEEVIHKIEVGDLEILEIDGCEYIVFKDGQGTNHGFGYMAHKGNCKNPIHCYKTVTDSLDTSQQKDLNQQ